MQTDCLQFCLIICRLDHANPELLRLVDFRCSEWTSSTLGSIRMTGRRQPASTPCCYLNQPVEVGVPLQQVVFLRWFGCRCGHGPGSLLCLAFDRYRLQLTRWHLGGCCVRSLVRSITVDGSRARSVGDLSRHNQQDCSCQVSGSSVRLAADVVSRRSCWLRTSSIWMDDLVSNLT